MGKLTYKFVKEQIEKEDGYKLLSKEYVDNRTKLEVQCPEGHEYEVSYSSFKQGRRCPICAGNKKLTYKFVKEQIEKVKGYKLVSKEYVNAITKLEIQCPKGHIYEVQYASFKQGNRCQQCSGNRNIKLTYEFVKDQIESVKGFKLLSKEYVNGRHKLEVRCPEGHKYKVAYSNFKQGKKCPICSTKIEADKKRHSYGYIKEQIENAEGYKLLSKKYVNNASKLEVRCPEGHKYEVAYCNFSRGKRCPHCSPTTSKGEKEVLQTVKTLINKEVVIEENDRTQIINPLTGHNLELDIWIPSLNKAIEYNGEYWHSSDATKARDREKVSQCKEKGIDLLVINENDWQEQNQKIVNEIKVFLQLKEKKGKKGNDMYNKDLSNYQNVDQSTVLVGRELEAYVLTKSANKLRACKNNWDDKEKLIEVLEYNQKIWIIFQDHLSSDECEQPMEVRLNLLQLIKFIDTRTYKIMSGEMSDSSSLDIIISINNGIAQGLRMKVDKGGK